MIEAFGSGVIEPDRLVGRTIGLDALGEAFDALSEGSTAGKILIMPA